MMLAVYLTVFITTAYVEGRYIKEESSDKENTPLVINNISQPKDVDLWTGKYTSTFVVNDEQKASLSEHTIIVLT